MLTQIKNVKFYLQAKLGQRGAEMVEYAIVLACICAVGVAIYGVGQTGDNTLDGVLKLLWSKISGKATEAVGK